MQCGLCGETSHPSSDCPLRGKNIAPAHKAKIDAEYEAFLAEIGEDAPAGGGGGGGAAASGAAKDVEKSYEQFMAEIEGTAAATQAPQQQHQQQQQAPQAPHAPHGYPQMPYPPYGMYPPHGAWNPWMAQQGGWPPAGGPPARTY